MRSIISLFWDVEYGPGMKEQICKRYLLISNQSGASTQGLPGGSVVNDSRATRDTRVRSLSGRSPGEGKGSPLQYPYLENPHAQRSLAGHSPWSHKEPDSAEWLSPEMVPRQLGSPSGSLHFPKTASQAAPLLLSERTHKPPRCRAHPVSLQKPSPFALAKTATPRRTTRPECTVGLPWTRHTRP